MYKILLIDDEPPVHQAICALVDWPAFHAQSPRSAYNGQEALAMMERFRPDVAFVDMRMPLMDGVDFLSIASRNHPYCQYIVVSGYDAFEYAQAAIRVNVVDYLLKPIERSELEQALRRAILRLPERDLRAEENSPVQVISAVKEYIDRHFREDIRVDELAERFFFSREYLSKLFREQYGCPLYEYVLKVRMDSAKESLRDPGISIHKISEEMGYSNANYFGKAFKRRYGITPSEFRSQAEESQKQEASWDD